MDAYFSPTDDANENFYQFYGVYGRITDAQPKFAFRFCSGKHKVQISPWELFEAPEMRVAAHLVIDDKVYEVENKQAFAGPWPKLDIPEDWMGQHSTTTRTAWSGNNNNSAWGGGRRDYEWEQGKVWSQADGKYVWPEQKKTSGMTSQTTTTTPGGARTTGTTGTEKKRDIVETETSRVEIVADEIVSKYTREQVVELVQHLCDFGYDYYIYEAVREEQAQ